MRLKELRTSRKLNQHAVAEVLNCSQTVYSRYENGDREPPLDVLIKLADFYKITLDELVGRVPMEIEVIHGDPPPISDDEVEIVIEPGQEAPSVQELEKLIMGALKSQIPQIVDQELKKRGL